MIQTFDNFTIEDLGVCELDVYDIEVENDHNFFGNNILVHNSGYINISYLMNKKGISNSIEENIELAGNIGKKVIQKFIDKGISDICYLLNAYDNSVLDMEQELVTDKFISTGDKRYYARYYKKDKKTNKFESKLKITGLNIISKSTPPWCKEKLKPVLEMILDKQPNDVLEYITECKNEFSKQPIENISIIKGVSSLKYDWSEGKLKGTEMKNGKWLGAPIGSRAAILFNEQIKKLNLDFNAIRPGDKVFMSSLKIPNPVKNQDIIGFNNPSFIEAANLKKYIDYDTMFSKNFMSNVELITIPIGWSLDKYKTDIDDWS